MKFHLSPQQKLFVPLLIMLTIGIVGLVKGRSMNETPLSSTAAESNNTDQDMADRHGTEQGFQHDNWQTVLQTFVGSDGRVDYQGLAQDRTVFDRYLEAVKAQSPESHPHLFPSEDHSLAYYLNAYNALVFEGVLSRGPEKDSVWSGLVSGYNFFVKMKVVVGGQTMSLKKLEDKKILAVFEEPRVHAALNCASVGCPPLSQDAYRAKTLDAQLQTAAERWINDPYHCQVNSKARTVTLNKIFDWFRSDFISSEKRAGNPQPNLIHFVNRFRPQDQQIPTDYKVRFSSYDKRINDLES